MTEQMSLAQAFQIRPNRFRLLMKGIARTGWNQDTGGLLEAGCSVGDAAAYLSEEMGLDVTAFDLDEKLISEAKAIHEMSSKLHYDVQDAARLTFEDESYDGLYCEAAFSPMPDKGSVLKEYRRVLKPGALVLVNDFVIKSDTEDSLREEVIHIPCFAGVQTRECYEELFKNAGFESVAFYEEYGELLAITMWLCKVYKVSASDIGGYLSQYFHTGASRGATCADLRASGERKGTFFKRSDLSFCQMIYRRI